MASEVLKRARETALDRGEGIGEADVLEVLTLPEDDIPEALALAHEVRLKWCGDIVEVEGIISLKTGGCPEDCGYCPQSIHYDTGVARDDMLPVTAVLEAARAAPVS